MNFIGNRNFRAGPQTSLEGFICPQNSDKKQKIKVFGRSGGASAKISTMKSTFVIGGSDAKYDVETGKFEWSTSYNNWMELFTNLEGQVSKYKHLKINLKEPTHDYRLLFYNKGNKKNVAMFMQATETVVDLDLTQLDLGEGWTFKDIDRICIAGKDGNGSFTITPADVTLETDDIETLPSKQKASRWCLAGPG